MAVAYGTVTQPGLLSQQYPPPLLPKPGKDNIRLQKLLKRTAKKKASTQASQSATPFRSSLSPVNEASPDLEHSDHFTPPRTPDTPQSFYGNQPPRFTVRLPYQHVASPYPQRAAYGRGARMSPQTVVMPSYSYSQHVTTVSYPSGVSTALGQVPQPGVPKVLVLASSVSEVTVSAAELKKSAFNTLPLTVLTPLVKPRSPRPTFKATEPSRSPKPMFDVPQIRMYTASTSFYETSRITTPTAEVRGAPPTAEVRGVPPTAEIRGAPPTAEVKRVTPTRVTPTAEVKRATPTADVKRATPTAEVKRATPTADVKRATPTAEIRGATPTAEVKRATPTAEIRGATPTAEVKRATPTAEIRAKTPTYEFQTSRTAAGRPKTPAYHVTRAATPVFEISRPNPLLFAVSPVTVEPERSRTPQTVLLESSSSASQSVKTTAPPERTLNGGIQSDMISSEKPVQPSITKSKSEPDLSSRKSSVAPVGSEEPKAPITPAFSGQQRAKTPTYEASRLMTTSPGYKRPKTPTYGTLASDLSPVGFQRPTTAIQVFLPVKGSFSFPLSPSAAHRGSF
uniref:Proline rich 33 n=1 Tax=Amphilophus citrinellus TaxID=61819 RepID=A0A3Q0S287_AMPCI